MTALRLEAVSHAFGKIKVLQDISLNIGRGELIALLGPSGCGKTTLLRLVAGLETLQMGEIFLDGISIARPGYSLPIGQRGAGMVFQDYALFGHMTVLDNVLFGMKATHKAAGMAWLERMGIAAFAASYPHLLSGGQQQRVALARALAAKPRLLLLDEPFSGLDARLRQQVRLETRALLKAEGMAALLVTHDADEAMHLADRIILMNEGHIEQHGTAAELYCSPRTPFTARFFGYVNEYTFNHVQGVLETPFGRMHTSPTHAPNVTVIIRPEAFIIARGDCPVDAMVTLTDSCFVGHHRLYTAVCADGTQVVFTADPQPAYAVGTVLSLNVRREGIHIY
jgi:iron(III) transport system ATP-binding protein